MLAIRIICASTSPAHDYRSNPCMGASAPGQCYIIAVPPRSSCAAIAGMRICAIVCEHDWDAARAADLVLLAVALDRWEALKLAWMANTADWGYDVEATTQDGQLLIRAPEGPAVALLHSDAERREFISAGAAAGLAASPCLLSTHHLRWQRQPCPVHI